MGAQLLSTAEHKEWNQVLERLPQSDVYFTAEYHQLHELHGDGLARAFVFKDKDQILFYPFLLKAITRVGLESVDPPWYDLESVYGYSGPLSTTRDDTFLRAGWNAFSAWCQDSRVVAEFVRLHPLLENEVLLAPYCNVSLNRPTVVVRLEGAGEELWSSYPSVQRNRIMKARRHGLVCRELSGRNDFEHFKALYLSTMSRVQASPYYLFSTAYFEGLFGLIGHKARLFVVLDHDKMVAAAVFLLHADMLHYHLGGSDADALAWAPNNLLFHTVAEWGQQAGYRVLHLGGGRTAHPDDELLRFKTTFSRQRKSFHVGRRIHDAKAYEQLCSAWLRQMPEGPHPQYFLFYRLPRCA